MKGIQGWKPILLVTDCTDRCCRVEAKTTHFHLITWSKKKDGANPVFLRQYLSHPIEINALTPNLIAQ